jgi:hypothetical protein
MEHSFAKSPEKDQDQYFQRKTENLISIYNHILDQEEKISEFINNEFLDKEIQEMEIFRINEKRRLEQTKKVYYARQNEVDSYNKLLSEIGIKQILLEMLSVDEKKDNLSFKLKNNYSVEVGKRDDGSSKEYNKKLLDEDEDKCELVIIGYTRNEEETCKKIYFKFFF